MSISEDRDPVDSTTKIQDRAELLATTILEHQATPTQLAYAVVQCGLEEAVLHLRDAASRNLSGEQLYEKAYRLERLAEGVAALAKEPAT